MRVREDNQKGLTMNALFSLPGLGAIGLSIAAMLNSLGSAALDAAYGPNPASSQGSSATVLGNIGHQLTHAADGIESAVAANSDSAPKDDLSTLQQVPGHQLATSTNIEAREAVVGDIVYPNSVCGGPMSSSIRFTPNGEYKALSVGAARDMHRDDPAGTEAKDVADAPMVVRVDGRVIYEGPGTRHDFDITGAQEVIVSDAAGSTKNPGWCATTPVFYR